MPLDHRRIGQGWATWSPGYPPTWDKSVYYTTGATSVTLTMPAPTDGLVFFAEPKPFSKQTFTVVAQDGTTLVQAIHGSSGAAGFGFYGTGGDRIETLRVSCPTDFAIGEFYGALPEPTALGLLGAAAGLLARRRR
jgi:hypothetical protein